MSSVAGMVSRKLVDYRAQGSEKDILGSGLSRAVELLEGDVFAGEMKRFLPERILSRTVERPEYREAMAHKIEDVFEFVADRF